MARFRGTTKDDFLDNRQEVGNAFDLFIRAQRFIRDHLPVAGRIVPGVFERIDEPLYPTEALREAIANALCHRDYSIGGGAITVAIYDDRLEIGSAGPLPFGLTADDLTRPHASRPWNPLIAQTFYRRGVIEKWGRGTLKMIQLTENAGWLPPIIAAHRDEVTITFRAIRNPISPLQQLILRALRAHGPLTLNELMTSIGEDTPMRTIQDNLQALRKTGLVALSGARRASWWSVEDIA